MLPKPKLRPGSNPLCRARLCCESRSKRGTRSSSHSARIAMLDQGLDCDPGRYTYPPQSKVVNSRHFYQNTVLMDWFNRSPRPVSLRQLAFFGRKLNTEKIISSANFVQTELPVRLAHRIREMQTLPYSVISNPYLSEVYELYYTAFDRFRKFPTIKSLRENERYCELLASLLDEHLAVIPKLVMGAIENSHAGNIEADRIDQFMSSMLRSRISRRVIAEQHISLTNSFGSGELNNDQDSSYIGAVFLQCNANDTVLRCGKQAHDLIQELFPDNEMPEIIIEGDKDVTFPYIKSHIEYIVGELLRNSVEATVRSFDPKVSKRPLPILVSISNTPQNVFIRISDQGKGIPQDILPHIWSFAKGPGSQGRLENFKAMPTFAGLSNEIATHIERAQLEREPKSDVNTLMKDAKKHHSSLTSLAQRGPQLKLGMGLPLSRVYAEYWDGQIDLYSLEGYGCDVFLRISRLGNQMERLHLDRV
jgi:pyruvate dehydrogenase kinase 2/3/4